MQEVTINKTVLSMRLGLFLAFSYVMLDAISLIVGGRDLSIVGKYASLCAYYFFLIFPFVFLYRMTVNFCCQYNDCKYQFSTPFAISFKGFVFGGILYSLFFYLYMKNFAPNLFYDSITALEKESAGQGYDEMFALCKEAMASQTPKSLIPYIYLRFLLSGLIVSLFSVGLARFAKLRKPVGDNFVSSDNKDSQYDKNESNEKKDN